MPIRQRRLPTWFLAVLVFGGAVMFWPFLPWMLLALWLGMYARRFHEPLTKRLGGRTGLSATITVSMLLVIVLPIAAIVTSIVLDAVALVQELSKSQEARAVFVKLVENGNGQAAEGGVGSQVDNADEAMGAASGVLDLLVAQGGRAYAIARDVAGMAARFVIGMLVLVTGMYGILVEGQSWYAWIERHTPLSEGHFRRLGAAFVETGRGLWWGIIGAGFLQSIVATVTYLALGVPSALALGLLTLVFSVIPAIGTAIVWAPVAAGLAITGRPVAAIVMAAIGVFVVGTVDNLARPWLAHRGKLELPTWVVLTSMFGGIELLGAWGLVVGPLAVRLAKEALVISREARDPATAGPPVESPRQA